MAETAEKEIKSHAIWDILIRPPYELIISTKSGAEVEAETNKILFLDDAMGRHINDMSVKVEKSVSGKINDSNIFVSQVYEFTDIGEKLKLWYQLDLLKRKKENILSHVWRISKKPQLEKKFNILNEHPGVY